MEDGEVMDGEEHTIRGEKRSQVEMEEDEDEVLSIKPPPVPTKKHKRHHKNKDERHKKRKKKRSRSKERNKEESLIHHEREHEKVRDGRNKDVQRRVKVTDVKNTEMRLNRRSRSREKVDNIRMLSSSSHSNLSKFDKRRLGLRNYDERQNRNQRSRYEQQRDREPVPRDSQRQYSDKHKDSRDSEYRRLSGSSRNTRREKPAAILVRRIDDDEKDNDRRTRLESDKYQRDVHSGGPRRRRQLPDGEDRDNYRSRHENSHIRTSEPVRVQRVPSSDDSLEIINPDKNIESAEEKTLSSEDEVEVQSGDQEECVSGEESEEDSDKEESSEDSENESSGSGEVESGSGSDREEEFTEDAGNVRSKFDSSPEQDASSEEVDEAEGGEESESSQEEAGSEADQDDASPEPSPEILKPKLPYYLPAIQGCRSVDEFQCLNRIEEGTYGVVYRAKDKKTQEVVALKRLKMEKEREGFPITSLREVCTLLKAHHTNIVKVQEIVVGSNMDKIYIVMDYVEHDMKSLMETMKQPFLVGEIKTLMIQLLRGVHHLHDNWILHRDLKTSNLLLSHKGILKIGDFGLAREYGSPLKPYTPIVVTLWYRSPELLLGEKEYSTMVDVWSVGCIFAEFLTLKPLFPGRSETMQLNLIFKELGTPSEKIWPGYEELPIVKKGAAFSNFAYNNLRKRFGTRISEKGFDLLNSFLTYCPSRRTPCGVALRHAWFKESPSPVDPAMFPTWPAKSEQSKTKKVGHSPKAPQGGAGYNKLLDAEDGFQITQPKQGISKQGMGFNLKF